MNELLDRICARHDIPRKNFEFHAVLDAVQCMLCGGLLAGIRSIAEIQRHYRANEHLLGIAALEGVPDFVLRLRFAHILRVLHIRDGIYSYEDNAIRCNYCHMKLSTITLTALRRHHESDFHTTTTELKARSRTPSAAAYEACSPHQNAFSMELCDVLLSADIPLDKLRNPTLRAFLEKYIQQIISNPTPLRTSYVPAIYRYKLQCIREEIGENRIMLSVDETTDSSGRIIAHAIVRPLCPDRPGKPRLIHSKHLQAGNAETIAEFVIESLTVLWPEGIHHCRLLIFCTDGAPYMMLSGRLLANDFLKMVHVKCVCHCFHRVCETIRDEFEEANAVIAETKKVFLKSPLRVAMFREHGGGIPLPLEPIPTRWGTWLKAAVYYSENFIAVKNVIDRLIPNAASVRNAQEIYTDRFLPADFAHIAQHYECIARTIETLETEDLPLHRRIAETQRVYTYITETPDIPAVIRNKMLAVFENNHGYNHMKNVDEFLRTGELAEHQRVPGWEEDDYLACRYASLESADVERSFSRYKAMYRSNRQSFKFRNLLMHVIICCYGMGFVCEVNEEDEPIGNDDDENIPIGNLQNDD